MEFGVGIKFHGTFKVPWNSMELPFWHGKVPWNSMEFHGTSGEFHGIPWNSMELWNIDINKFHNWGSVFQGFLYDFMSLFIRQSISSWNNEIFQFQSNFLVPLILVKWQYSILNGGLLVTLYRADTAVLFQCPGIFIYTYRYDCTLFNLELFSNLQEPTYGTRTTRTTLMEQEHGPWEQAVLIFDLSLIECSLTPEW